MRAWRRIYHKRPPRFSQEKFRGRACPAPYSCDRFLPEPSNVTLFDTLKQRQVKRSVTVREYRFLRRRSTGVRADDIRGSADASTRVTKVTWTLYRNFSLHRFVAYHRALRNNAEKIDQWRFGLLLLNIQALGEGKKARDRDPIVPRARFDRNWFAIRWHERGWRSKLKIFLWSVAPFPTEFSSYDHYTDIEAVELSLTYTR